MDPNIVAVATASKHGRPSVRMMIYRGIREGGFSFFTNYESRKGRELADNPFAAIVFYWPHLGKQVRIEGEVQRLSTNESDAYFQQRPLLTQITAPASPQSRVMPDHRALQDQSVPYPASSRAGARSSSATRAQAWPRCWEMAKRSGEAAPGIADASTAPIDPFPQNLHAAVEKLPDAVIVTGHAVVIVVPPQLHLQQRKEFP